MAASLPKPFWGGEAKVEGRLVGGIDFGLRNPFAAVWGTLDRRDVLWLTGEHYSREKSLDWHCRYLPRDVTWYADPAGAREIRELCCAGYTIHRGDNELRPGLAAVRARVEGGRLKVVEGRCPNLLAEAGLYRYSDDRRDHHAEVPLDEHNHALAALRYLISRLDARHMARLRTGRRPNDVPPESTPDADHRPAPRRPWLRLDNEDLWTPLT